jgi:predicted metal-binding protein
VHTNEAQEEMRRAIRVADVNVLSVAYVSGFIARRLLRNGSCDACKACLISESESLTNIYIAFKERSCTGKSLTYPTEKLVETVGTAVCILEGMILEVAHLDTVEACITSAIKKGVNF